MKPSSEPTKLEAKDGFTEYKPAKKLEGNNALITGGEYVYLSTPLLNRLETRHPS